MILPLILAAALSTTQAPDLISDDQDRQDNYESLLSCAAFHTIEATRAEGSATEAQQAVAYDFAKAAVRFAPDSKVETTNSDLEKLLGVFRERLDTGDARDMAEGWTALEKACLRLYSLKDDLDKDAEIQADVTR